MVALKQMTGSIPNTTDS